MTKGPRKSIIASFASYGSEPKEGEPAKTPAAAPPPRVGASVIGATQRSLAELREERDSLRALVDAGATREIDPALIDPSPFRDRMPDDDGEAGFDLFRRSIAEEGQKVPVEVRPHPDAPGRFQLVYGHRRWRAAAQLGVPLRALVVEKSDAEAAVSQGIENAARQDLSWIERAGFAATMEKAGIRARDIRAALGVDDPELARFRAVQRVLPAAVIAAIGRAPKTGRPRWIALTRLANASPGRLAGLAKTLTASKASGSDERFVLALEILRGKGARVPETLALRDPDDQLIAQATFTKGTLRLVPQKPLAAEWEAFLREDLPDLAHRFARWQAGRKAE